MISLVSSAVLTSSSTVPSRFFFMSSQITFTFGLVTGCFCHKRWCKQSSNGKNRCFVGIDLFGNIHDILLIKCDQRSVYRHIAYFVCCNKTLHRLGSYLTDAFRPLQAQGSLFLFCDCFCNPHHVAAHNDRQLIMWAFLINGKLYIRKVYNVQADRSRIVA